MFSRYGCLRNLCASARRYADRLKLSEIAFDSKHEHAAFVYSSMKGKGGTSGTVVYELKDGQWKRKAILNFRIAQAILQNDDTHGKSVTQSSKSLVESGRAAFAAA